MKNFKEKVDELFWRWGWRPNGTMDRAVFRPQTRREFWLEVLGASILLFAVFLVLVLAALVWNSIR